MATKLSTKTKRLDQFMLRLPDGMRDKLAKMAEANGRSMNAEILSALEQHLAGTDRLSAIEAFIQKHRTNIEAVGSLGNLVELEMRVTALENHAHSAAIAHSVDEMRRDPDFQQQLLAGLTSQEAQLVRKLLRESGFSDEQEVAGRHED
jgi:hypothetical protein